LPGSVSHSKEFEPGSDFSGIKEVVEHTPPSEVRQYVSSRSETINLPPEIQNLGLEPVSSSTFSSYQNVKLPLPDEKIIVGLRSPVTSSLRWLATLGIYLLGQAHLGLKVIGGKVVRVIKP